MPMTMKVDKDKEIRIVGGVISFSWKEFDSVKQDYRDRTISFHLNKTECLALSVGLKNEAPER
jgi:hypothetical protein